MNRDIWIDTVYSKLYHLMHVQEEDMRDWRREHVLPLLQMFYDTASLSTRCREQLLDGASLAKLSRDTSDYSLLENFEALFNKMSRSWCQLSEGVLTDLRFSLMDVLWQPGCEFRKGLGPIRQSNAKSLLTATLPPRAAGNARTWLLAQRRYEALVQRLPSARGWRSTWLCWCRLVRDFTCLACATHSFNDVLANCTVLSASIPSVEGRLHKRIRIEETFSKERSEDWDRSIPFSKILMERLEPIWHRIEVSNSGLKGFDRELMRCWLCQFIELGQVLYYLQWQIAQMPLEAAKPMDTSLLRPLRESLCDIERNGWVIHSFEEATDYARGLRGYSLYPHRLGRPSACRVSVPPLRELKSKDRSDMEKLSFFKGGARERLERVNSLLGTFSTRGPKLSSADGDGVLFGFDRACHFRP
jgi:hypothetical protein